jgi:hypothetical protein
VSTALARLTNLLPEVIGGECLNPRRPNRAHGAGRISDERRNVKMLAAYSGSRPMITAARATPPE